MNNNVVYAQKCTVSGDRAKGIDRIAQFWLLRARVPYARFSLPSALSLLKFSTTYNKQFGFTARLTESGIYNILNTHTIDHFAKNTIILFVLPPRFCISIVFAFSLKKKNPWQLIAVICDENPVIFDSFGKIFLSLLLALSLSVFLHRTNLR